MERNQQKLVIALASALGLAVVAIAFLLGRMSSPPPAVVTVAVPTQSAGAPQPQSAPAAAPSQAPIAGDAPPAGAPLPVAEPTGLALKIPETLPFAAPPLPTTTTTATAPRSAAPADQPQIAAYFGQVDRLEDMGGGSDPQSFANTLVQSMSSGDFSGFDDLLAKARAQRQRLQAIAPPKACVEHHRLALALSGDSVAMLERVKAAMVKGDTTALLSISTDAKALETQANQLKSLSESIKRQAGL